MATLSIQNDRLLTSASFDKTARLWVFDTNHRLNHPYSMRTRSFLLPVTGCMDKRGRMEHPKDAGLEDFPSIPDVSASTSPTPPH
jgi:hypothetical protein